MDRNLEEYWKSISREFESTKNRIRDLIGNTHWQTDGEAKEAVFRNVLSSHISELVRVGRGFVSYPEEVFDQQLTSTQLDVLITDKRSPTLFKDGDLAIVTPDAVIAIVEVKTDLDNSEPRPENSKSLRGALIKLAIAAEQIRLNSLKPQCQAGLFIFQAPSTTVPASEEKHKILLRALRDAASGNELRAINWVAWGPHFFARYWQAGDLPETGEPYAVSRWHTYDLEELAQGYFLSNLVLKASYERSDQDTLLRMEKIWYPIKGGKKVNRRMFVELKGDVRKDWD